tara:strand:+ start:87 stop:872 length:786 start_codon:yes stop_codon:yes gene_type:complete
MSHVTFYIKADKSSSEEEIKFLNDKYSNHSVGNKGDAGLDLYCPRSKNITAGTTSNKINLGINCELMDEFGNNLPYLLMPRSSTGSKTPLRMSNSLGLIDAGYRGPICACVDNVSNLNLISLNSFELKLLKICFTYIFILCLICLMSIFDEVSKIIFYFFISVFFVIYIERYIENINYDNFLCKTDFLINQGDRLFQLVPLIECKSIKCKVVEELSDSARGEGGFGSTGQNDMKTNDENQDQDQGQEKSEPVSESESKKDQ